MKSEELLKLNVLKKVKIKVILKQRKKSKNEMTVFETEKIWLNVCMIHRHLPRIRRRRNVKASACNYNTSSTI